MEADAMREIHDVSSPCEASSGAIQRGEIGEMKKIAQVCLLLLAGHLFHSASPSWALAGLAVPQSPMFHAASLPDEPLLTEERRNELFLQMREQYYSPWRQTAPREAAETLRWIFDRYGKGGIHGENLRPRPLSWVEQQRKEARIKSIGELNRRGVSVCSTSLRLMPTIAPVFLSPDLPGEGYPFDYLQNSLVHPGEPLFVSHLSLDGLWAWCDTSYASGWIPLHDLTFVDETAARRWMALPLAAVVRENTVLRDGTTSLFRTKVGTLLPLIHRGISAHMVVVPLRGPDGNLLERAVRIAADAVAPMPLPLTPWTIASLAEECMGELYGWGGFLENRDCSATTRDILLPFGIWLPRNSGAQAQTGKVVSLENLSPKEKKEIILKKGIPFLTLLGQPGHVMLYIGAYKGEPLVLQNLWGVRTEWRGREGRFVIGRCVISTLDLGSDLPEHAPGQLLIERLNRMALPVGETFRQDDKGGGTIRGRVKSREAV